MEKTILNIFLIALLRNYHLSLGVHTHVHLSECAHMLVCMYIK